MQLHEPFKVNDYVRIRLKPSKFERSYTSNFSTEVYQIKERLPTYPVTWRLDKLRRKFYTPELVLYHPRPKSESSLYNFIAESRNSNAKTLRSGKKHGAQREFLMKNYNRDKDAHWISEEAYKQMMTK